MKNIKSYAAVALLALALTACGNDTSAAGYGGDITAKVTMEGDKIKDIEVDHTETEGIGADAVPILIEEIKKNNGTEGVDNVSGATVTSEALKTAVDKAIKAAK